VGGWVVFFFLLIICFFVGVGWWEVVLIAWEGWKNLQSRVKAGQEERYMTGARSSVIDRPRWIVRVGSSVLDRRERGCARIKRC
jgi:hypothetical protein